MGERFGLAWRLCGLLALASHSAWGAETESLGQALNATNLTWISGGAAAWLPQSTTTRDGLGAAQSGAITHSQQTWLETTVAGPGPLSFWWKVSSESSYDYLEFFTNGVRAARISGAVDWQVQNFSLGTGLQVLRWRYLKDGSVSSGQDRGWVDQVSVTLPSGPPDILAHPAARTNEAGTTATLSVAVSGSVPFTYQWFRDGILVVGETASTLTLDCVTLNDAGLYSVVVSNALGSITSGGARLTVVAPTPPTLTQQPQDLTVPYGATATFSAAATGSSPLSYQWRKDGTNLDGETYSTLTLYSLTPAQSGLYSVVISNSVGLVASSNALLTVCAALPPSITQQPTNLTVRWDVSATFTVTATGTSPLRYQWRKDGTNLAGKTYQSLTLNDLTTNQTGLYSVVVSNLAGSVASSNALLIVLPPPSLAEALDATNLLWSTGSGGSYDPTTPSTHDGVDALAMSTGGGWWGYGQTLTLGTTVTGPTLVNWWWRVGHTATYGASGGSAEVALLMDGIRLSAIATAGGTAWHLGTAAVPVGTHTLEWSLSQSPAMICYDPWSCSLDPGSVGIAGLDQVTLTPATVPLLVTQPADQTVVAGSNLQFSVAVCGAEPLSYQWQLNQTNLVDGERVAGVGTATLVIGNARLADTGFYRVIVHNAYGTATSTNAFLTVLTPAPNITMQPRGLTVAAGGSAAFTVGASATLPLTYQWLKDGASLAGATNPTLNLPAVTPSQAGAYSVVVSNAVGSVSSAKALLLVSSPLSLVGSWPGFVRGTASDVFVTNGLAFVAQNWGGLAVMSVTNPANPVMLTRSLTGGQANRLRMVGNVAYLVQFDDGVAIVDLSDPTQPRKLGAVSGFVQDVQVVGNLAYGAHLGGLQIHNIADPANPVLLGRYTYTTEASCQSLGLQVVGSLAFFTRGTAGLQIFDVSDPATPVLRASYLTGGEAEDVQVVGTVAYVADGPNGLLVLDVSNPSAPVRLGSLDTGGLALGVVVQGNLAYVADDLGGLLLIEVSNPSRPVRLSGFDTVGYAYAVRVVGNLAYVADWFEGLQILDVSSPTNPAWMGSFDTSAYATRVQIVGQLAYVADGSDGLVILDLSAPEGPVQVGRYNATFTVGSVRVVGNLAYVTDSTNGLQVLDVSQPTHPRRLGGCQTGGDAQSFELVGALAYVADGSNGLQIIDVSHPANPVRLGGCDTAGSARAVQVVGHLAYLADGTNGLVVINVSNPAAPLSVGSYDTGGIAQDVQVVGHLAYVADYSTGLHILDVANPATPVPVGGYDAAGTAFGVQVVGTYAYLADGNQGLKILDVTDPANPVLVGGYDTPGEAASLQVVGNRVFLADGWGGLAILDTPFGVPEPPPEPPVITGASVSANGGTRSLLFSVQTTVGRHYQVLYKADLNQTSWLPLGEPALATDRTLSFTHPIGTMAKGFYRVQETP